LSYFFGCILKFLEAAGRSISNVVFGHGLGWNDSGTVSSCGVCYSVDACQGIPLRTEKILAHLGLLRGDEQKLELPTPPKYYLETVVETFDDGWPEYEETFTGGKEVNLER
jgi:hypothetical protein